MVELGQNPLYQAERGTSGKGLSAGSVLLKPDALPIVRSEGIRRSRTQMQGGLLLLTFLGRSRKVSAARHERDHGD